MGRVADFFDPRRRAGHVRAVGNQLPKAPPGCLAQMREDAERVLRQLERDAARRGAR